MVLNFRRVYDVICSYTKQYHENSSHLLSTVPYELLFVFLLEQLCLP